MTATAAPGGTPLLLDFLLGLSTVGPITPLISGGSGVSGKTTLKPLGGITPLSAPEPAKTLESYHNTNLSKLRDDKDSLAEFQKELIEKKAQLERIEKEFSGPSIVSSASDIYMLTSRQNLEKEINRLEEKIRRIQEGNPEADYFLNVGDILFAYTDAQQRLAHGEKPIDSTTKKGRIPANSVYSYFSMPTTTVVENVVVTSESVEDVKKEELAKPTHVRASDIRNDIGFKRDKALESYLSALDPDKLQHENFVAACITEDFGNCPICEKEMLLNETFLDCPTCGYRDAILIDSEKPSYKDPPREMVYYAYKKINHFNEWLSQFQAKETTEIPAAVLDQIRAELKKDHLSDMTKLKTSKLKDVIKKLKLSKYYDHIPHVLARLKGVTAPVLSREVEEKLRFMFKEIQFSFVNHCPKKRSNFLSYSFVLYKFCELLELDEFLPCFPLLKSHEKLYMQDKIWKKICEDMRWEFIPTV